MEKIALYRKYRPQKFADVVGQEHIVRTITNEVASGNIAHAYIFSGPRGSGKTTMARLLAKAINCRNHKAGDFEPCNKCSSCLEINNGRSLDLIEIDAASHRGIDEVRQLKEGIKFPPSKEKCKIFIIDEAHQLTKEAANALLKTLEEPPEYAVFIMATTEIHKMIPTIVSRCQRFDFRRLSIVEIVKKLKSIIQAEKVKIGEKALEIIALNSGGAIRDAETLLEQVISFSEAVKKGEDAVIKEEDIKEILGLADIKAVSEFVDFLIDGKSSEAVIFLNKIMEKGYDIQEFSKLLIQYLRQILILKINPDLINSTAIGLTKEEEENIKKQSESFTIEDIQNIIDLFLEANNKMKYSFLPQLPLELAIVKIIEGSDKEKEKKD